MLSRSNKKFYILRTGHVYGPYQWLSKYIFETVESKRFALPFNGRRASNAIHVDNLSSGICDLIFNSPESGIYNFTDYPQRSWRELYDWHTKLLNKPPVPTMLDDKSELQLKRHLKIYKKAIYGRAVLDLGSWLKRGRFNNIKQLESLTALISQILSYFPSGVERGMKAIYNRWSDKEHVVKFSEQMSTASPLFYCLEVPGPYLPIPKLSDFISYTSDQELRSWLLELG